MVERLLSMQEVLGSIPRFSNFLFYKLYFYQYCVNRLKYFYYRLNSLRCINLPEVSRVLCQIIKASNFLLFLFTLFKTENTNFIVLYVSGMHLKLILFIKSASVQMCAFPPLRLHAVRGAKLSS